MEAKLLLRLPLFHSVWNIWKKVYAACAHQTKNDFFQYFIFMSFSRYYSKSQIDFLFLFTMWFFSFLPFSLVLHRLYHIYFTLICSGGGAWRWRFFTLCCSVCMCVMTWTEQAATRIQAVFRGHKVRASMKQGDSSANSNNTKSATSATSDASNEQPSQEELKAEFREDDKGK